MPGWGRCMATVDPTISEGDAHTIHVRWELGAGDDGSPVRYAGAADRTVQILGAFGGATVTLQGTLEETPTTWSSVTDAQGNAIAATSATLEAVTELVRFIRPLVTGGTGTAVSVLMMFRPTR
jgi:hypothetical protein